MGIRGQGALSDSLGAPHDTPPIDHGNVTCFCESYQKKAKERGINVGRAKQGFLELEDTVLAAFRAGAPGVFLSRKYSEMRLANLSGAGECDSGIDTFELRGTFRSVKRSFGGTSRTR